MACSRSGLLRLGGEPGRRPAALDVDDDERQLEIDGQADRLGLEVQARATGRGDPERPANDAPGRRRCGDLVLGWKVRTPNSLRRLKLVQDVRAGVIG